MTETGNQFNRHSLKKELFRKILNKAVKELISSLLRRMLQKIKQKRFSRTFQSSLPCLKCHDACMIQKLDLKARNTYASQISIKDRL